jgi:hypothetical protein
VPRRLRLLRHRAQLGERERLRPLDESVDDEFVAAPAVLHQARVRTIGRRIVTVGSEVVVDRRVRIFAREPAAPDHGQLGTLR